MQGDVAHLSWEMKQEFHCWSYYFLISSMRLWSLFILLFIRWGLQDCKELLLAHIIKTDKDTALLLVIINQIRVIQTSNAKWFSPNISSFKNTHLYQFSSVQSLSHVWLFVTPWTAARQACLSITNFQSLPRLMSTESVMPSKHLILCHPLLLSSSIFPSIRVFSNESVLHIRWPNTEISTLVLPANTQDWPP